MVSESGTHSVKTHFPKDSNCAVCLKTKITRASCRRSTCTVVPKADFFGDLITLDHKVLSESCESRNNHRYAVVVQDLTTQWIQSYPCKTKTSQETERSLQKFLEPNRKPKVIYTNNSLEFGKACEELSWTHCTSTPHRSETNGIAERAVRRIKEGTSAVLLQSGLDDKWRADSMECCCYLRNIQSVCSRTTRLKNNQEKRRKRAFNSQNGKRRQRCCSYYENFTTIGFCLARLRAITTSTRREVSGKPRQKVLGSIRRLRFTQSTLRQAGIRENKGTSLGKTQVKNLHQRSPHAMKFEDRSHEETERQLRCARSKAWNIAKNIYKLKRERPGYILLARGRLGTPGCVNKRAGGKRVSGRFRSEYGYGQQERP